MDNASRYLERVIADKKLAHAYLFKAFPHVDIQEEIKKIVEKITKRKFLNNEKTLRGTNIYNISDADSSLKKEVLLDTLEKLKISASNHDDYKILIINNIENASKSFNNSLLKTIEEPPRNVLILITTNDYYKVIPTIKSRCQIINVPQTSHEELIKFTKKLKYQSPYPYFWVEIFNNKDDLEKFVTAKNDLLLKAALVAFKRMLTNKGSLLEFLITNLSKQNAFIVAQIVNLILRLTYSKFTDIKNRSIDNLVVKLRTLKIPTYKITLLIDAYLKQLSQSSHFQLSKEKLILEIKKIVL